MKGLSWRRRREWIAGFLVTMVVATFSGCGAGDRDLAFELSTCEDAVLEVPVALLLVGSEGVSRLCDCAVRNLREEFPEASRLWAEHLETLERRLERRGLLGIALDTIWLAERSGELEKFVEAFGESVSSCAEDIVREWSVGHMPPDGPAGTPL